MHNIIIIAIIVCIVYVQLRIYQRTKNKLDVFKNIFSDKLKLKLQSYYKEIDNYDGDENESISDDTDDNEDEECEDDNLRETFIAIEGKDINDNPIRKRIINSINSYLENNNNSVSDFHLLKDIVDRNCDAAEEEIDAQIPMPLYLGLAGTMAGILVGVGYLVLSGGLNDLLTTANGNGADGIEALLFGVALAMIASIVGISLTTYGSSQMKDVKTKEENGKHIFLSWMQANLLPALSNDTSAVLSKMTENLAEFNRTFTKNTKELRETLSVVNDTSKNQADLLDAINKLKLKSIATANIDVYDKLRDCTEEIGQLGEYLQNVNGYLQNVRALNDKLDVNEERTKAIERMGSFFEREVGEIEQRKSIMSQAVGRVDDSLQEAFNALKEHAEKQMDELKKANTKQQDALQERLAETTVIVDELRKLSAVKDAVLKFETATKEQNKKIDDLAKSIKDLAQVKANGGTAPLLMMPSWIKISVAAGSGFIVASCLFFVVVKVISLFRI